MFLYRGINIAQTLAWQSREHLSLENFKTKLKIKLLTISEQENLGFHYFLTVQGIIMIKIDSLGRSS